jgi:hypothetical protein
MEPAALDLMEMELDRRGVTRDDIADHDRTRRETAILLPDGTALRCSFCNRPAVVHGGGAGTNSSAVSLFSHGSSHPARFTTVDNARRPTPRIRTTRSRRETSGAEKVRRWWSRLQASSSVVGEDRDR